MFIDIIFLNIWRIEELKEEECRIIIQDVMYLQIMFKSYVSSVSLVPRISKCIRNGRPELLPDSDTKLKYIHSWELWDAIMKPLTMLTCVTMEFFYFTFEEYNGNY